MTRHGGLLLLLLAVAAAAAETTASGGAQSESEEGHLLPHPLVIELPMSASCGTEGGEGEEVSAEVRCASWRLAAEANNLAPWRAVPKECAADVREYVTGVAYRSDLEVVAREASAYACAARVRDDGRDAWVFDVDETLLSNLPYYAEHGYGLELFNHYEFDKWVERGEASALGNPLQPEAVQGGQQLIARKQRRPTNRRRGRRWKQRGTGS